MLRLHNTPVFVFLTLVGAVACMATANADESNTMGRVEFDFITTQPANVEIDLKHGMLSAINEITKAAVDGVAQGIRESSESAAVQESTEHLRAVNEILGVTSQVVKEVRVRIYEGLEDGGFRNEMFVHYQDKLAGTNWDNVVRIKDNDETVVVCVLQHESAFRGVFVIFADGNDLILANVVCDMNPDTIRQLTNQATKIGMKFGLEGFIENAMSEMNAKRR